MITLTEINQYFYEKDSELYWKNHKKESFIERRAGCISIDGYKHVTFKNKGYYIHRILWSLYNQKEIPEGLFVDHIDGNKSNNSKENLRLATNTQNQHNSKLSLKNKTGIKGLSEYNDHGVKYYRANIKNNNIRYYKVFKYTPEGLEQAKIWLETTRKELHGEFARDE